jgi:uncharacterized protein (DUF169 family)
MGSIQQDLSIFNKFKFERPPVGVKFLFGKPEGIKRLDKTLALCEMIREAQQSPPFYVDKENFECVGPLILGMAEPEPLFESGQIGPRLELFKEPRANNRIYYYIPRMIRDTVNYLVFSPLDKLSFTPDVLIVSANPTQAEIILRAMTYTTGKMWTAKGTSVIECSWMFVYPYLSGELNFTVTGLSSGMKAREVFPPDLLLISIPWDLLSPLVEGLQDMKWVPIEHTRTRDENSAEFKKLAEEIQREFQAK